MIETLLEEHWLSFFNDYHTLFVGLSGGLDSTVLLHCLAAHPLLAHKLHAVHVHHGLSANATSWQNHCQQVCDTLDIPLKVCQVDVQSQSNVEENARIARYQAFASLIGENDCIVLAHHCDDQAETVLLQLFRGSGINGLAAMASVKPFAKGCLARPLLEHSRQTLETYAHQHQLVWVNDESNQDTVFSRNFLRHEIMPMLRRKWPGIVNNVLRTANHCQNAKLNLEALAEIDYEEMRDPSDKLSIIPLLTLDYPRIANVIRVWLQHNHARLPSVAILNRIITEVMFARSDATPLVEWGEWVVRRYQQHLYIMNNQGWQQRPTTNIEWPAFPEPLHLRGIDRQLLYATPSKKGLCVIPGNLLSIRFRKGGELFYWRGQTKQLKKLFQEWQVPTWQRDLVPLLYINEDLAAVVGFAVSDYYYTEEAENTFHVELNRI